MYNGYLTDIDNIVVGHAEYKEAVTGTTAVLFKNGATCGIDVRGSAPGTRETDLLVPYNTIAKIHGIVLSGGSAFGLDACSGVVKYLEEQKIGFTTDYANVPIVSGAVIYDLGIGSATIRPDLELGYLAAKNATSKESRQGNVGAGYGATVGKVLGMENAMKAGLGSATIVVGDLKVSAMTVVNAFGDIYDFTNNQIIAGAYNKEKKGFLNSCQLIKQMQAVEFASMSNTTISIVATNAKVNKTMCTKIAQMAHDGYARSINPVHTMMDGDTIFAVSAGEVESDINIVGTIAAEVVSMSITNAIKATETIYDVLGYKTLMNL